MPVDYYNQRQDRLALVFATRSQYVECTGCISVPTAISEVGRGWLKCSVELACHGRRRALDEGRTASSVPDGPESMRRAARSTEITGNADTLRRPGGNCRSECAIRARWAGSPCPCTEIWDGAAFMPVS